MSKEVDERVVEMQFNNTQFEKNVATSMNTLDKLKASLNFSGAADSFGQISSAAKNVDFSSMSSSIDGVSSKFSALEVVAVTALMNITNSAIEAGEELLSSLSVDQISAGWEKFSENTTNVGTLVSQGYDLEEVNEQMDRLLWYTDETSYNYTDMVSNISKFTAAGQGLEESVTAMEGIANWAALSGQNAVTASRAMYQLSQAMSSGYMRKQDYVSVQNANMDTQEFRQTCLDAAVALGTLRDNGNGTYTSIVEGASESTFTINQFADNLTEEAWLTSDVMMSVFETYGSAIDEIYEYAEENGITASEAIEQMGDSVDEFGLKAFLAAQEARTWEDVVNSVKDAVSTGWMDTFTYIFGDYEEAKTLWTDLANAMYDVFMASSEARNAMLEEWSDLGGRTVLIDTFWQAWENVADVLGTVKEAFRNVFPHVTGEQLYAWTESLQDLVDRLKLSDEQLQKLETTFEGFFSIFDIFWQAIKAIASGIKEIIGYVLSYINLDGILDVTSGLGQFLINLDEVIQESGLFQSVVSVAVTVIEKVIDGIVKLLQKAVSGIKTFYSYLQERFNFPTLEEIQDAIFTVIGKVSEKFNTPGFDAFANVLEKIQNALTVMIDFLVKIKDKIVTIFSSILNFLIRVKDKIVDVFSSMSDGASGSGFLETLQNIWEKVKNVASVIGSTLVTAFQKLAKIIQDLGLEGVLTVLKEILASGVLVGIIQLINKIKNAISSFTSGSESITKSLTGIFDSVANGLKAWKSEIQASYIIKIAAAIAVLAVALRLLANIDGQSLAVGIAGISSLFGELVGSMAILNKIGKTKGATSLLVIAAAILLLTASLKKIAALDVESMAVGVAGVGALLGELAGFLELYKLENVNSSGMLKSLLGLIVLAMAIKKLAKVVISLAELSWEQLAEGLTGVTVLMGELLGFLEIYSLENVNTSGTLKTLVGLMAVAFAVKILAKTVESIAEMSWAELGEGLAGAGAMLAELAGFTQLLDSSVGMVSTGLGMIEIAVALKMLAKTMGTFAEYDWSEIAKGLVSMGGALMEIAAATAIMPDNMFSTGLGLIEVALALKLMYGPLNKFSGMSWVEIAKGLVMLGGAMAELAAGLVVMKGTMTGAMAMIIAAAAIDVLVPALLVFSLMSWESIAKSLITLAGAFAVMGAAGAILSPFGSTLLVVAAAMLVFSVAIDLLAVGVTAISVAFLALVSAVSGGVIVIVESAELILTSLLDLIPTIIECAENVIIAICTVLKDSIPVICDTIMAMVAGILTAIADYLPEIVETLFVLIMDMLELLIEYMPTIIDYLVEFIIVIIDKLTERIPDLVESISNFIKVLFNSIFEAFDGVSVDNIIKAIIAAGLLAALMAAFAAVSSLTGPAMIGVLGVSAVVAEMAGVLAAFGALSQIPGLTYLVGEGGNLLQEVGTAIGKFIGGIVGGIVEGFTSELGQIGTDLSLFMANVQPFLEGASEISADMLDGVMRLVEVILALTATEILNALTSWLTGGKSLEDFGMQIAAFGPYLKQFSDSVEGVKSSNVKIAANAATELAEFAKAIPNEGGLWAKIAGDNNDLEGFGKGIAAFGPYLKKFSDSVEDLSVENVQKGCDAAMAVTEFAKAIPNEGGLWAKIAGDNTLADFAKGLKEFGPDFAQYCKDVKGITEDSVAASNAAAQSIIAFAVDIPNSGGLISLFQGDNDIGTFGKHLSKFGEYFKEYYKSVRGIDYTVVDASVAAAESLSVLAGDLPDDVTSRGLFGGNDLKDFGKNLEDFGTYFYSFYEKIKTINAGTLTPIAEGIATVILALNDMPKTSKMETFCDDFKNLCDTASGLDTSGLAGFGKAIQEFAPYMVDYANQIKDIDDGAINSSTEAAEALAALANSLPHYSDSKLEDWYSEPGNMDKFGLELEAFGAHFKVYADTISEITNLDAVTATTSAAESMAAFADSLPNYSDGAIASWFGTAGNMAGFGAELETFAESFANYAKTMSGIKNLDAVATTTEAAEALAALATDIPETGGFFSLFTGDNGIDTFGKNLEKFGASFTTYADEVKDITEDTVAGSNAAIELLIALADSLSDESVSNLGDFAGDLKTFGNRFNDFINAVKDVSGDSMDDLITAVTRLRTAVSDLTGIDASAVQKFFDVFMEVLQTNVDALSTEAETAGETITASLQTIVDAFADEIDISTDAIDTAFDSVLDDALITVANRQSDFRSNAKLLGGAIANGITDKESAIRSAMVALLTNAIGDIGSFDSDFKSAGKNLMKQLIRGFNAKKSDAEEAIELIISKLIDKIGDMDSDFKSSGNESVDAYKDGLNIEAGQAYLAAGTIATTTAERLRGAYYDFYSAGSYLVQGFANGITVGTYLAESAATSMANAAKQAAQDALGENSPSKEFYSIGAYAGIGLANALTDYTSRVYSAGSDMGEEACEGLSSTLSTAADIISDEMDDDAFVITPVLNLDEIQNGMDLLYSMMDGVGIDASGSYAMASQAMIGFNELARTRAMRTANSFDDFDTSGSVNNNASQTINNTFNITNDDPNAVATRVSRIIQKQVERREASWGR